MARPRKQTIDDYTTETLLEIEKEALAALARGAERIAVKKLIEDVRDRLKIELDHTPSPQIADWLIHRNPQLDRLIERRARGQGGPRGRQTIPPPPPPGIEAAVAQLRAAVALAGGELLGGSLMVRTPRGTVTTVAVGAVKKSTDAPR